MNQLTFFLLTLAGTQCFALCGRKLTKRTWTWLDFVMVGTALTSVVGAVTSAQKEAATSLEVGYANALKTSMDNLFDRFETASTAEGPVLQAFLDETVNPAFSRITLKLLRRDLEDWPQITSEIDDIDQKISDVAGDSADPEMQNFFLRMDSFFGDEGLEFLRRGDSEYDSWKEAKEKGKAAPWYLTFVMASAGYLGAVAAALRAAKISAELRGFKEAPRVEVQAPPRPKSRKTKRVRIAGAYRWSPVRRRIASHSTKSRPARTMRPSDAHDL